MEETSRKARELFATCHEHGYTAVVGIANTKTGESIGTGSGQIGDILLLTATVLMRMEGQAGVSAEKMAKEITKAVKKLRKERSK